MCVCVCVPCHKKKESLGHMQIAKPDQIGHLSGLMIRAFTVHLQNFSIYTSIYVYVFSIFSNTEFVTKYGMTYACGKQLDLFIIPTINKIFPCYSTDKKFVKMGR